MTERRFYSADLSGLDGIARKHARVLRLSVGDDVTLFDEHGRECRATVVDLEDGRCEIGSVTAIEREGPALVLIQGIPKGSKLDDVVRASTEVGVTAIHLAESERSVPRADEARANKQLARLSRIAQEAARQSLRADVPDIVPPAPLDEVIGRAPTHALRIAFAIDGAPLEIDRAAEAWIVIGPEGGLSPAEVERARALGFAIARIGDTVLRVETAAPVALALVRYAITARERSEETDS